MEKTPGAGHEVIAETVLDNKKENDEIRSLRYVQVLLEYNSSKTIGIYTHVANTDMNFIKNPLD